MDPEQTPEEELSMNEKIAILMEDLPVPVQNFLRGPERDAVSSELSTKYNLHADQAGVFERSFIYMLLGVYTPEEFVQELTDAGIPQDTVRGLTADVNERVFKPLQNAERATVPPTPIAVPVPVYAPPAPAPFVPPTPVVPASIYSAPVPTPQPVAPAPQPFAQSAAIPVSPAPVPTYEHPAVRTMAHDMQMMKEGGHAQPTWQPSSPARTFQTSSVPNTGSFAQSAPAIPSTPAVPQPQSAPIYSAPVQPRPAPPIPHNLPGQPAPFNAPHAPAASSPPIIKEYGVDPYREMPQ
jgi:hypothetical protein